MSKCLNLSMGIFSRKKVRQVPRVNQRSSLLHVDPHGRQDRQLEVRSSALYFSLHRSEVLLDWLQKSPGGIRFASIRGRKIFTSGNHNRHSKEERSEVSPAHHSSLGLILTFVRRRIHAPGSGALNSPANRKKTRVKAPP